MSTFLLLILSSSVAQDRMSSCDASVTHPKMIAWASPGVLTVDGSAGEVFTVRGYVRLGELSHRWTEVQRELPESGRATVVLDVPAGAYLDDLAVDYVTDLLVQVDFGDRRQSAPLAHILWETESASPEVILAADLDARAPNGVTRPELRRDALD